MPDFSHFVGIDVAMDKLDIHIHPAGTCFALPNTGQGVAELVARLPAGAVVALEASGGYERCAAQGLSTAGMTVFCLHPADVRALARLKGKRAKTDRLDAALIAHAAQVALASRQPYSLTPSAADMKEMAATRRLLLNQSAALKGQLTRLSAVGMRDIVQRQVDDIEAAVREIDALIQQAIAGDATLTKKARRIQTAPGAGPILAATLLAYLPELGTLSSRQAASLIGVAPHPRQSGTTSKRGRCLGGRSAVRKTLYMATLAAIRTKASPLKAFFERLRANGKPFKLAMVAAMRKFIVTLNAMIKSGQNWRPSTA